MKKLLALLLACGLGLAACGGTPAAPTAGPDSQPEQENGETELPESVATMAAPIHALAETMLETGAGYQPRDPEFFWKSLHFFLQSSGSRHGAVGLSDEGVMRVPRKAMQEHAIALFSDYDDLLELPESLSGLLSYDEGYDAYLVFSTDYAPYTLSLAELSEKDGTYRLEASLSDVEGEKVGVWEVLLTKNTYADGIADPLYPFSISSMRPLDTQAAQAFFNGLTDAHTVEVTLEDGSVAAFQFDAGSEASEALQRLDIGEAFTMEVASDGENGTAKIIAVR